MTTLPQRTAIGIRAIVIVAVAVVLVAAIGVIIAGNQGSTVTTLSPNPGGSTTHTTGSALAPCPSDTTCAPFTYVSSDQVRVNSVQATETLCNNCGAVNGQSYVGFEVNFENVGNSTIYIAGGTGELSVSTLGNSSVLHAVTSQVCAGTFTIIALGQGQNYTMYGPGCDAGFDYQLVQSGEVTVTFSFDWTTSSQASTFPNSTEITAQFSFA